ncbi:MAG: hypothetical protein AB7G12_12710 [Thermoanaerobaculia bacterium]
MSVEAADLVVYGSADMRESDTGAQGGAIDETTRVVFDSSSLANTLNDTVDVVSSNAGDTTQTVTVTGRSASGSIVTEELELNGTTTVNGSVEFERILKVVIDASHAGTVTLTKNTGGSTVVAIETGVLEVRRPFYNVSADVSGGSSRDFYEKVFVKNNDTVNALLACTISEQADPESQITFAVEDAQDDNGTSTNRITAPAGITGDGFSGSAKTIPGTDLAPESAIGVWLKLTLPAGDPATKTTYTLRAAGSTT